MTQNVTNRLVVSNFCITWLGRLVDKRCRHGHRILLPWVRCGVCKP